MTELETMKRAKTYIDKLAKGINPLDDSVIPEGDVINNVRLSRCLFYVSDVLRQVIENGGVISRKSTKKDAFNITLDELQRIQLSDTPIPVSKIAEIINSCIDNDNMKKLSHRNITDWLVSVEVLQIVTKANGKIAKRPTVYGNELGITTEERTGMSGNYTAVFYNRSAQQFIVDNIYAIIDMMNRKKTEKN